MASPAAAQTFPELTGRVVDQANLLPPQQEADLTARSEALEKQTGAQFVVATINSLEDRTIEDYGYQLGRHWGIGRAAEDDGVILLVAPNEKKVRIETGYGAEGVLPDILAGRIIRHDVLPRFRDNDMAGGIMAGANSVLAQLSLSPEQARENVAEAQAAESARENAGAGFVPVIFWGMIILFVLLSMARRASGRRYRGKGRRRIGRGFDAGDAAILLWGLSQIGGGRGGGWGGGGFGGGGGFSGGGGGFGGGGASGSW
ncbi:MAG: TPM domain-containing protein [Sphingomonas sp.]|nr:TPM domain-containing protein [Sphingomonas sp.]